MARAFPSATWERGKTSRLIYYPELVGELASQKYAQDGLNDENHRGLILRQAQDDGEEGKDFVAWSERLSRGEKGTTVIDRRYS